MATPRSKPDAAGAHPDADPDGAGDAGEASPEGDAAATPSAGADPAPGVAAPADAPLRQNWRDSHHLDVEVRTDASGAGSTIAGVRAKDVDTVALQGTGGTASFTHAADGAVRIAVRDTAPDAVVTVNVNINTVKGLGR